VNGPAAVLALVLAETAAGAAGFLFLTPLWTEVKRGFFYLTGAVVLLLSLGAAGAARSGIQNGSAGMWAALALSGVTLVWLLLMRFRAERAARILGVASVGLALAMLLLFARDTGEGMAVSSFQLIAGALFTGAVLDGLLLGHWYLTDRKLTRGPINRMTLLLIVAVLIEAGAVLAGGVSKANTDVISPTTSLSPLLTVSGNATWIAFGMVACTGLIAAFIRAALKGTRPQAVQSATGFFYLAVITAFTAELAAKVRFLP